MPPEGKSDLIQQTPEHILALISATLSIAGVLHAPEEEAFEFLMAIRPQAIFIP